MSSKRSIRSKLNPRIVAVVNDGVKDYQNLHKYNIQVVSSYKDLRGVNWRETKSLIIQTELNWVNRRGPTQSTYDGYYFLIELLDWGINYTGTVGLVTRQNLNIFNESNNRIFPFMEKVECIKVYLTDDTGYVDNNFWTNHYHMVFPHLQREYDNGFLQFNTGGKRKEYIVKHENGIEVFTATRNTLKEYIIRKKNFWRTWLGKVSAEHYVLSFLKKQYPSVLNIKVMDI